MSIKKHRILVAPLDWGLGHATRCIPIIRYLLEKNIEVIIAADKRPFALLQKEFPSLEFIVLSGYNIKYPKKGSMLIRMIFSVPKILKGIRNEHKMLNILIREKKIDAVISDNRYGLYSNAVPSVFITHQLNIQLPFAEKIINSINRSFISKYKECWIPDHRGSENLSGDLSHQIPLPGNCFFIGPLSRFDTSPLSPLRRGNESQYDLLIVLSGPEPQRSVFEEKVVSQVKNSKLKIVIVRGMTENDEEKKISENVRMVAHLNSEQLQEALLNSKMVLSRPGYSTVMDLAALGKKTVFVPTPGQTEQEYLGKYLMQKGIACSIAQKDFNLSLAFEMAEKYGGFKTTKNGHLYKERIDQLIETLAYSFRFILSFLL